MENSENLKDLKNELPINSDGPVPKKYDQWVEIKIFSSVNLKVQKVQLDWGKFYQFGDNSKEIDKGEIEKIEITPTTFGHICACGRSGAWAGTEGSFELHLYEKSTGKYEKSIGKYYWSCPYGSNTNTSTWTNMGDVNIEVSVSPGHLETGPLGMIQIDVRKKD